MKNILRIICISALTIFLGACVSASKYHTFLADDFKAHNLYLTSSKATFNEKKLLIEGGIRTRTAPSHVDCGYIDIKIFNQQSLLLKTVTTEYSPCELHRRPKAPRTGFFSAVVEDIEPQQLIIKLSYREK